MWAVHRYLHGCSKMCVSISYCRQNEHIWYCNNNEDFSNYFCMKMDFECSVGQPVFIFKIALQSQIDVYGGCDTGSHCIWSISYSINEFSEDWKCIWWSISMFQIVYIPLVIYRGQILSICSFISIYYTFLCPWQNISCSLPLSAGFSYSALLSLNFLHFF